MVKAEPLQACTVPESQTLPCSRANEWGLHAGVKTDGETGRPHVLLGLDDCERSVMENRGGEHGAGVSEPDAINKMIEGAGPPGGDDRSRHGVGDGPCELEVEPGLGAIAIH